MTNLRLSRLMGKRAGVLLGAVLVAAGASPAVAQSCTGSNFTFSGVAGDDTAALKTAAQELCRTVRLEAQARGELKHLDLEVSLYKGNYFFWSLFWFLMAFIVVASSWLKTPNPQASSAARLAGLPSSVITRARQVMARIEKHSKIAVGLRRGDGTKAKEDGDVAQLDIFGS